MKISFNVNDVLPMITQASAVVNQKVVIPILADLVIKTVNNRSGAIVTASDSDTWVDIKMPLVAGEVGEDFSFAVQAKDFSTAIKNLSGHVVSLELNEDSHTMTVRHDKGFFSVPYESADDFPRPVDDKNEKIECIVNAETLYNAISSVSYATAVNLVSMPCLNGIHIDVLGDRMVVNASDYNHLVRIEDYTMGVGDSPVGGLNIPNKPTHLMESLLKSTDGNVKLSFGGGMFSLSCEHYRIVSKQNAGNYPDFNRIIPKETTINATVCKEDILSALKRVQPMGSSASELVVFTFTDGLLNLSTEDIDFSKAAGENVACDYKGDDFRIGLKGSYVAGVIGKINDDNVMLGMTSAEKPVLLKPESQDNDTYYIAMIMPIRLNNIQNNAQ